MVAPVALGERPVALAGRTVGQAAGCERAGCEPAASRELGESQSQRRVPMSVVAERDRAGSP